MLLVFLVVLIFFTPMAIFSPGENKNRAVVTAVGIDRVDDEIELSLLTFVPTANPTYLETNSVVCAKGSSITEALYQAQILMGKRVGLSHARTTVVGDKLLEEDIAPSVDYLTRIASLSENTIFIGTNGTAKDFLRASQRLGQDLGLKLEQLIGYDVKNVYVTDTTLESFYQGYFSPVKTSMIGYVHLIEESECQISSMESGQQNSSSGEASGSSGENGGESGGSGSGGNSGGNSGGESGGSGGSDSEGQNKADKKIANRGDAAILKNGKKVQVVDEKTVQGLNIINPKARGQAIKIYDVSNEDFNNATLTYAVRNKNVKTTLKMQNGVPIFAADVNLGLELVEIDGKESDLKLNSEYTVLSKDISDKIEAYCKEQFSHTLKALRKNKSDLIRVSLLMQTSGDEFKNFYEKLEEKEDILNEIVFQLTVHCESE